MTYDGARRRKRHPIRNTIIVLVIIAGLGISGYLVADSLARNFANQFVQAGVAQELGASDNNVHVNLGKGAILPQVVQKKIKVMRVTIDGFTSGTLAGSAVFDAHGVPLNTTDPVSSISITVSATAADLLGLVDSASGQSQATVALVGNNIRVSTTESVLGKKVPVSIDYLPTASAKQLVLTPVDVVIGSKQYTVAGLKASPYGRFTSGLVVVRQECLAAGLPASMTLDKIAVVNQRLVISASGTHLSLGSLSDKGVCPAS
ncbi:MAG: hypothetical protein QOE85_136 [Actinomycetota bacterium]|nr:hypothetical protein [Actinomycetota bacterium]